MTGKTLSLTVRREVYIDPFTGQKDPAKKGVASNFIADTQPGDEITLIGPYGKEMLFPEIVPNTDYILFADGTGVAPYRSIIRRLFFEDTPAANAYKGEVWLFLGVGNSDALLYDDEFQDAKARYPDNFRFDYILSSSNSSFAEKVDEHADEIIDKLRNGAHIYFTKSEMMMNECEGVLQKAAKKVGLYYQQVVKRYGVKKNFHYDLYSTSTHAPTASPSAGARAPGKMQNGRATVYENGYGIPWAFSEHRYVDP